jgi:hypothetical protein
VQSVGSRIDFEVIAGGAWNPDIGRATPPERAETDSGPSLDRYRELRRAGHPPRVAERIAYDELTQEVTARAAIHAAHTDPDGYPLPGTTWPLPAPPPPVLRMVCPECGEPAVHRLPNGAGTGSLLAAEPARQRWSHRDGEPLCPVVTESGYQPALPVRTGPTQPTTPIPTAPSGSTPSQEAPMTAEEPQDMQELAHYLDTGVEEAEALAERARRLEEIADADLRLTPRLTNAIREAGQACLLASQAVAELPAVLRSDLDV